MSIKLLGQPKEPRRVEEKIPPLNSTGHNIFKILKKQMQT